NADEVAVEVDGLPADPTPSDAVETPVASGAIEAPKEVPPIVIPENDPPMPGSAVPMELSEVPSNKELPAPPTMPPAGDMEESETLHMPAEIDVDAEYRSWWETITGWFRAHKLTIEETPEEQTIKEKLDALEQLENKGDFGECREDRDYHHHYP